MTRRAPYQRGLTLIELMVALAVALILVAIGMPNFGTINDKRHARGTVDTIQQDLRLARAEAIKRNVQVTVSFTRTSNTDWCYGINVGGACDCTTANSCMVDGIERVRTSVDLGEQDVSLLSTTFTNDDVSFDPTHGTASAAGDIRLQSQRGVDVWLRVSLLGQLRVCSPDNPNDYGFETSDCN